MSRRVAYRKLGTGKVVSTDKAEDRTLLHIKDCDTGRIEIVPESDTVNLKPQPDERGKHVDFQA